MEGFVYIWVNYFYQYQKKYVILNDFLLTIKEENNFRYNYLNNCPTKDKVYHVKYININTNNSDQKEKEKEKGNYLTLSIGKELIYFKTENEEDTLNWSDAISKQKIKYEKFIDEYYLNNNSERLLEIQNSNSTKNNNNNPNISLPAPFFTEFLDETDQLLNLIESHLNDLSINSQLDQILYDLNNFITKIQKFTEEVQTIENKKFNNNDKEKRPHFLNKTKELKTLFFELKEMLIGCTYGLNSEEINHYIESFKACLLKRMRGIRMLIDEVKYLIRNYIKLYLDGLSNNNDISEDNTGSILLAKTILENELKIIKIKETETQTNIIKKFMMEY